MKVEAVRKFCLAFADAKENLQWGDDLCFKVREKIFAVLSLSAVPPSITFKCDPETFAELCERDGIHPAAYVGRYKWVTVDGLDILPADELKALIRSSYEMISTKPRSKRTVKKTRKRG